MGNNADVGEGILEAGRGSWWVEILSCNMVKIEGYLDMFTFADNFEKSTLQNIQPCKVDFYFSMNDLYLQISSLNLSVSFRKSYAESLSIPGRIAASICFVSVAFAIR